MFSFLGGESHHQRTKERREIKVIDHILKSWIECLASPSPRQNTNILMCQKRFPLVKSNDRRI